VDFVIQEVESDDPETEKNEEKPLDRESLSKTIKEDPLLNKLVEELGLELT
jgi:hypothetical protein